MEDVNYSDSYRTEEPESPPQPTIKDYKEHPIGTAKMTAQRKLTQLKHLGRIVESQYEKRTRKVREFLQTRMNSVDEAEILQEGTLEVGDYVRGVVVWLV